MRWFCKTNELFCKTTNFKITESVEEFSSRRKQDEIILFNILRTIDNV